MTREEAKNIISWIEYGVHQDMNLNPYELIDEIYNDFESRTCDNCRWYKNVGETFNVCKLYGISHGKDFGCNKFESKQA